LSILNIKQRNAVVLFALFHFLQYLLRRAHPEFFTHHSGNRAIGAFLRAATAGDEHGIRLAFNSITCEV